MDLKIDETIESIIETSTTEFNREHINSIAKAIQGGTPEE